MTRPIASVAVKYEADSIEYSITDVLTGRNMVIPYGPNCNIEKTMNNKGFYYLFIYEGIWFFGTDDLNNNTMLFA